MAGCGAFFAVNRDIDRAIIRRDDKSVIVRRRQPTLHRVGCIDEQVRTRCRNGDAAGNCGCGNWRAHTGNAKFRPGTIRNGDVHRSRGGNLVHEQGQGCFRNVSSRRARRQRGQIKLYQGLTGTATTHIDGRGGSKIGAVAGNYVRILHQRQALGNSGQRQESQATH